LVTKLPDPENRRHYPGLDGLRAIAVLMVFEQHYVNNAPEAVWGWMGVRIFFALSGFLITGILYDTRNDEKRWSTFYARRALRIFPLYYGVLLIAAALYPLCRWQLHETYFLWPVYLQNFARFLSPTKALGGQIDHLYSGQYVSPVVRLRMGHFWSLAVEEQFYLIWPFIVFAVKRRETLMKICVAVCVLCPIIRLICAFTIPESWLVLGFQERFTFVQFDALLIGGLFALWLRGPHPDLTRLAKQLFLALAGVFLFSEVFCFQVFHRFLIPTIFKPTFGSIGLSLVDLWGAVLVLLAIDPSTWFSRVLQNRVLRYLGTISYGFYIYHDLLHDFYARVPLHFHIPDPYAITTSLVALICTFIIASVSFYAFERPILRLKRYFRVGSNRSADQRSGLDQGTQIGA